MREEGGTRGRQPSLKTGASPLGVWCRGWEGSCAGRSLTGQAGGGVNPLEQLPDAQLATLVGMAGQHQLAHLHLRGVPVALVLCHVVVLSA